MTQAIARVENLTVTFGKTHALNQLTCEIPANSITGLIGRNGSGKTTLLSVLAGFRKHTSGDAQAHGRRPWEDEIAMSNTVLIRESGDMADMKISEVIEFHAELRATFDAERAWELIDIFELRATDKAHKLSRGQKSALGVSIGLASRAPLTLLDEVHLGMDAHARYRFYDELLADYIAHPRAIVLSSHLIGEMERLIENVIILQAGKVLDAGAVDEFQTRGHTITGPAELVEELAAGSKILARQSLGNTVQITINGAVTAATKQAATTGSVEIGPVGLQDLFVHLSSTPHDTTDTEVQS